MCSGNIITKKHILTSASCIVIEKKNYITIASNLQVLVGASDTSMGDYYFVDIVMWHNNYEPKQFWKNDIGILRLERSIIFSSSRLHILLPNYNDRFGKVMSLTNWGSIVSEINYDVKYLEFLQVTGLTRPECRKTFPSYLLDYATQSCAKTIKKDASITMGDSGAGIVYTGKLMAIATAFKPDKPNFFIYTKIYPFAEFINYIIRMY
ncbi:trypsin beta-like [Aphidius gifuensis]|uniref:trypsin beta-like n=1 Tax=Aphidius gifuensis TaxID=684658 RepID=UPI001CDB60CE|nr:trypsin beta-like [Aphidius gifuensis]